MKIRDLNTEIGNDLARISAQVVWEDCDLPPREIYFETKAEFASDLSCSPHPFLVASALPAMRHGEERVAIEGEICPELRIGLLTAMQWIKTWFDLQQKLPKIEARTPLPSCLAELILWRYCDAIILISPLITRYI
jgi:hypothetical protein